MLWTHLFLDGEWVQPRKKLHTMLTVVTHLFCYQENQCFALYWPWFAAQCQRQFSFFSLSTVRFQKCTKILLAKSLTMLIGVTVRGSYCLHSAARQQARLSRLASKTSKVAKQHPTCGSAGWVIKKNRFLLGSVRIVSQRLLLQHVWRCLIIKFIEKLPDSIVLKRMLVPCKYVFPKRLVVWPSKLGAIQSSMLLTWF